MYVRALVALSVLFAVGCTSTEAPPKPRKAEEKKEEPQPEPEPPKVMAKASIASVQMIQDCPQHDPPPPPAEPVVEDQTILDTPAPDRPARSASRAAPGAMAQPHDGMGGDGGGWQQPCTQSTMQIAFTGQGDEPGAVKIHEVRMFAPGSDDELGSVTARAPTVWTPGGSYVPWDEVVPAGGDAKASYRLSVPNWSALERKLGKSSFGGMFVLEVELEVDGQRQTVRSPEFPREQPHVIVT